MKNQAQTTGAADATPHTASAAPSVDLRCALTLARVALQTLSDLDPEAASAVRDALGHEIETARTEASPDSLAVIAMLSDVRASLMGEEVQPAGQDDAWYID
jgi:hypothetical protein